MKILRAVLIVFMTLFCVFSAIPLVHEVSEAARSMNDPAVEWSRIIGALVGRMLVCVFFAWLAIAMWKKNRRSAKAS